MSDDIIQHLLDEMTEFYSAFAHFPLYLLGWELNDGSRTVAQRHEFAKKAFDIFTRDHPSVVVWDTWPLELKGTRPLAPDTPLDFELDPDGPAGRPMQVLVPATS